ncbi:MAG TPA: response regulator [Verrucomicrobiota bacterium]|nr:response regulator [Verrucomicrobiota bacterium]
MNDAKKRILVVDDEASITRLLKLNLEQTGYYLVRTENIPRAAVAAAEEFRPDLVLLDVMMPDLDGGDLASRFQTVPTMRGVPIVFLTAAISREEVRARHGLVAGQPFLAKPVNLHEVLGCLERHLGPPASPRPPTADTT